MSTVDPHDTGRLHRSRSNRMLAGLCGGLAESFGVHPAVFRVAFVVIALLPGAGALIYVGAALVVPDEARRESIAGAALRHRRTRIWPLVGLGLVAIAFATAVAPRPLRPADGVWILPLLLGAVPLWLTRDVAGRGAPDAAVRAAEDGRRLRRLLGVLAGVTAVAAAVAGALVAAFDVRLRDGVGDPAYVVARTQDLRGAYRLGVGELRLDLGSITLPPGETRVDARVDVGTLHVIVPDGVPVHVRAAAGVGAIDVLGRTGDGVDADERVDQTGLRVLVLDARVRVGSVDVSRAVP